MRTKAAAATTLSLLLIASRVLAGGPPLQAELMLDVDGAGGSEATSATKLEGGDAKVRARAITREDGRTASVVLRFQYTTPPDTIALDEIVDRIVVETATPSGEPAGTVSLDPNDVNLNPNGPRLRYQLSIYRPEGDYRVRVQVFGNYE